MARHRSPATPRETLRRDISWGLRVAAVAALCAGFTAAGIWLAITPPAGSADRVIVQHGSLIVDNQSPTVDLGR